MRSRLRAAGRAYCSRSQRRRSDCLRDSQLGQRSQWAASKRCRHCRLARNISTSAPPACKAHMKRFLSEALHDFFGCLGRRAVCHQIS